MHVFFRALGAPGLNVFSLAFHGFSGRLRASLSLPGSLGRLPVPILGALATLDFDPFSGSPVLYVKPTIFVLQNAICGFMASKAIFGVLGFQAPGVPATLDFNLFRVPLSFM